MNISKLRRELSHKTNSGFTLVELIVVMAVIAILAGITIAAVNPAEQLKRGRDTARITSNAQIGRAVQQYYTSQSGAYPAVATWDTALTTNTQEMVSVPTNPTYASGTYACTTSATVGVKN